jgi:hypothetical protein
MKNIKTNTHVAFFGAVLSMGMNSNTVSLVNAFTQSIEITPEMQKDAAAADDGISRKKRVTFDPSCLQSQGGRKELVRIPSKNMDEQSQRLASDRKVRMQISDTRKKHPYARLFQMAQGILMPGDPWNFVSHPSLKTQIPWEEVQKKSLEVWQNYTLDECIKQIEDVEKVFNFFFSDERLKRKLLEDTRHSYAALASVAGVYRWAFEALRAGEDPEYIQLTVENWFQNFENTQKKKGKFFAVDGALQVALERAALERRNESFYYDNGDDDAHMF